MKPESGRGAYEPQMEAPQLSARDRLRDRPPPKTRVVNVPDLGSFRIRELTTAELEEISEPLVRREFDAEGNVTGKTDSRGYHARAIAFSLVNDDLTPVYADPLGEGVQEIGKLFKRQSDVLWAAVDEMNVLSKGARDEMGKASGTKPTTSTGTGS